MKIGFDAKRIVQNFTGLGNYSRYVVDALSHTSVDDEWVMYAPKKSSHKVFCNFCSSNPSLKWFFPSGFWGLMKSVWRVWGITSQLEEDGIDLFHGLSNELPLNINRLKKVKKVVTIHDLIFLRFPQYYKWLDRKIYAYKFRRACELADVVVAISECTKRDIISYFHIPEDKIEVVYQGCDESFLKAVSSQEKEMVKKKYGLPDNYILNVGSIEDRKNVLLVVQAMKDLPDEWKLVIVGKYTPYVDKVLEYVNLHHLENRVMILNSVPFVDLPALYQMAGIFVYPSRFEGFGIPIVEALNSGVPVVAAKGSCLEEAGGPHSLYVHPDDVQGMAMTLNRLIGDVQLRMSMIEEGKKYALRFSEEEQARQLLDIYRLSMLRK